MILTFLSANWPYAAAYVLLCLAWIIWAKMRQAREIDRLCAANAKLLAGVGSALWVLNNRHNKNDPKWEEYAAAAEKDCRAAIAKAKN